MAVQLAAVEKTGKSKQTLQSLSCITQIKFKQMLMAQNFFQAAVERMIIKPLSPACLSVLLSIERRLSVQRYHHF